MSNVISLPASCTMTPKQALLSALDLAAADDLTEALVVGYDASGELLVRSSKMDRKDALWLTEQLKHYVLTL